MFCILFVLINLLFVFNRFPCEIYAHSIHSKRAVTLNAPTFYRRLNLAWLGCGDVMRPHCCHLKLACRECSCLPDACAFSGGPVQHQLCTGTNAMAVGYLAAGVISPLFLLFIIPFFSTLSFFILLFFFTSTLQLFPLKYNKNWVLNSKMDDKNGKRMSRLFISYPVSG